MIRKLLCRFGFHKWVSKPETDHLIDSMYFAVVPGFKELTRRCCLYCGEKSDTVTVSYNFKTKERGEGE